MIKFNSCLVIIGLSIGLFSFISHAATAAEAQQGSFRSPAKIWSSLEAAATDRLTSSNASNSKISRSSGSTKFKAPEAGSGQNTAAAAVSNDLQRQVDQFPRTERQQKQLQQEQQLNQLRRSTALRLNQPQRQQPARSIPDPDQQLQQPRRRQRIHQLRAQQQKTPAATVTGSVSVRTFRGESMLAPDDPTIQKNMARPRLGAVARLHDQGVADPVINRTQQTPPRSRPPGNKATGGLEYKGNAGEITAGA